MDLGQLRFFLETARLGGFAAVARQRGVAPSSVSRAVAALEAELGLELFTRTTRRIRLTGGGAAFRDRVEPLVAELDAAAEAAGAERTTATGTLRLLCPVSFGTLNVVPLLPAFLAAHPGLRVELLLDDAPLDLVDARVDVAVRIGPLPDSTHIGRRLCRMRSRVCASPGYLAAHGRPGSVAELAGHRCLLLSMPGFHDRWRFRDAGGAESHVDVSGPVQTSNAAALTRLALAGAGVILQGEWIVGPELARGELVDLFPGLEATASHFDNAAFTLRPDLPHEPLKARLLLEHLHAGFADGPPGARG